MANFDVMRDLAKDDGGKIVLLVLDGVGGLPIEPGGPTELEAANTPNFDRLAAEGSNGLSYPVARGIEPGSGPGHLGLFGFDPLIYNVGRGALTAAGANVDIQPGDVAARGNFCTVDEEGKITDRRAGRISTEEGAKAVEALSTIDVPGVDTFVKVVKEYRFCLRLRGEGLDPHIDDTDPRALGVHPDPARATIDSDEARHTADLINQFIDQAKDVLADHHPANMALLRGFATDPGFPKFDEIYKLKAACIAVYPMYKGVSRLVGMDVIETDAHDGPEEEFAHAADVWDDYDFLFIHIKPIDSRGEDGDFDAKVAAIEQADAALPQLLDLGPDVLMVTGDHSTPAKLMSHSWHPVPTILWAPETHMPDTVETYGERPAMTGTLGHLPAADLMQLAMAHAKRLERFGA